MIQFGFCLPIFAWPGARLFRTPGFAQLDVPRCMQLGVLAEQMGYHSLWVADHLMLGRDEAILEGWTTLAALAGMTHRARLGIIHYNNVFRHPAFTAKMLATLDQISGGRMIHFVDYGNNAREYLAYGLYADAGDEAARTVRIAQMAEGLELTLALWQTDAPVTWNGAHYLTHDAVCNPKPLQQPRPPIWMGEAWPELLKVAARHADAWNTTPVSIAELRRRLVLLKAACDEAGRDVATMEKTLEIQVLIAPDDASLRQKFQAMLALILSNETAAPDLLRYVNGETDVLPDEMRETWLAGTPDDVRARVQAYVAEGITHFMLWFVDAPDDSGLRLFAEQVMPYFLR